MNNNQLDQILQKLGVRRNFSQNQIIFIKAKGDQHQWPAKISSFFLQQCQPRIFSQVQDQYNPSFKPVKKPRSSSKHSKSNNIIYQLIYKIRYYQWQQFIFAKDNDIMKYTKEIQNKLMKIKDKKLQKALFKAKGEMTKEQIQRVYDGNSEGKKNQGEKKVIKIQKIANSEDVILDKKKRKYIKKALKNNVNKQKTDKEKHSQDSKDKISSLSQQSGQLKQQKQKQTTSQQKLNQSSSQSNKINQQTQPKIKQQYQQHQQYQQNQSQLFQLQYPNPNKSLLQHSQQHQPIQQYLLDNILFKNKYQILGIFYQILQDFSTKILWIDRQLQKVDIKKIKTLNKIIDAEIFKFQDLNQSKCLQKMLNIVRIGQLVNIKQKYLAALTHQKLQFIIQMYKTYLKIVEVLKKIKKDYQKSKKQYIKNNNHNQNHNNKRNQQNKSSLSFEMQKTSISQMSMNRNQIMKNKDIINNGLTEYKEKLKIDYQSLMNISILK